MNYKTGLLFSLCIGAAQLALVRPIVAQTAGENSKCARGGDVLAVGSKPSAPVPVQKSSLKPHPCGSAIPPTTPAAQTPATTPTAPPISDSAGAAPAVASAAAKTDISPGPSSPTATIITDGDWLETDEAASKLDKLPPSIRHVRVASPTSFIPSVGPFSILIFQPYVDVDSTPSSGPSLDRLAYRALIVSFESSVESATALARNAKFTQAIPSANVWPEAATRGTSASPGTDFKENEQPPNKTLLRLDANIDWSRSWPWLWHNARIYIVGSAGADGSEPRIVGSLETVVANKLWAAIAAILGCVIAYIFAAVATFGAHKMQRVYDDHGRIVGQPISETGRKPKLLDGLRSSFTNRMATVNKGHGPLIGTNYKSIWAHINPVVLSAGPNGLGSATNLQILFFSLIVFGVVCYIWMMTGHLTGLSSTVVLLMGISGIGATAAAGADVATNRLSFDNWAWLIDRGWLPPGGVAEVNAAKWKDIFTTNGAFDVYRFQMICFSVVVGFSIVSVGTQVTDLASFEVPSALLGILGLSQVVYVTGKLVAPPSISDLDAQITKLQTAEKQLRELNQTANSTLAGTNVVMWTPDKTLSEAQQVYADYCETWDRTKTMFETTIGRLLPDSAISKKPPFALSDIVLNKLPDGATNTPYSQTLILTGAPGPGPFEWCTESSGTKPTNMSIDTAANNIDGVLKIPAAGAVKGEYRFTLRVRGADPSQTITKDFLLRIF